MAGNPFHWALGCSLKISVRLQILEFDHPDDPVEVMGAVDSLLSLAELIEVPESFLVRTVKGVIPDNLRMFEVRCFPWTIIFIYVEEVSGFCQMGAVV